MFLSANVECELTVNQKRLDDERLTKASVKKMC